MAAFKAPKKFNVVPGNAADVTAIQDAASVLNPSMTDLFPAIISLLSRQAARRRSVPPSTSSLSFTARLCISSSAAACGHMTPLRTILPGR